jgi:hypothetical protein
MRMRRKRSRVVRDLRKISPEAVSRRDESSVIGRVNLRHAVLPP